MKYVILKPKSGMQFAVLGLGAGVTHADLAKAYPDAEPFSAGRVHFSDTRLAETFDESTSLKLQPHPDDARFLTAFYRAETEMAPSLREARMALNFHNNHD